MPEPINSTLKLFLDGTGSPSFAASFESRGGGHDGSEVQEVRRVGALENPEFWCVCVCVCLFEGGFLWFRFRAQGPGSHLTGTPIYSNLRNFGSLLRVQGLIIVAVLTLRLDGTPAAKNTVGFGRQVFW